MTNRINPILDTDSYKLSHFLGYPAGATHVYSYAESRGGKYPATVFTGIQKFVQELAEVRVTRADVIEAAAFAAAHGEPFNEEDWLIIVFEHNGRIPVRIKAVPEGTVVPTRNVLVTVENTDPRMPWLTSYIETALLRAVWYPVTVATRVHEMKKKIKPYYDRTSDRGDMAFALLDFSARGVSSRETSEVGGMAHLLSFVGSDNIPAVLAARRYYDEPMAAYAVAATEHSVMTGFGEENEFASFEYLIDNMMPENGILSVVSDTWNVYRAADYWGKLVDKIRTKNGTLVFRPDSGAMSTVLPDVLERLRSTFGAVKNSKGFDVLQNVKVLWGDGINEDSVTTPFEIAELMGISADSIMTGSGGGLMQANIDRDTLKFAFKASNITINGADTGIAKNPITDAGKQSKKGKLSLVGHYSAGFETIPGEDAPGNKLRTVYEDGKLFNMENLQTIRNRLINYLNVK